MRVWFHGNQTAAGSLSIYMEALLPDEMALPEGGAPPSADVLCAESGICYPQRRMTKAAASDPAFAAEMLRHADALHHFAWYLCRDASGAEDLVQETFARCFSTRERFTLGTNAKAWLFRILRNAFIDGQRRNKKNPAHRGLPAEEASDEDVRDGAPLYGDAEMDRLRGLVADDIEAALKALSADARLTVLMDLEGFTEAEMANVLGCAPGTVKSRLSRARAVLRERLKDYAR